MSIDLPHALQTLATTFLEAQDETDTELVQRLTALGMDAMEAKQWAILMPLAFARAAYRFQLPELAHEENQYVECSMEAGQSKVVKLDQLAPYMVANTWACDCGQMDTITSPEYNAIVRRSVEFKSIQELRSGAIQTLPPLRLAFS